MVIHITRGNTADELWKSEQDLKRAATIKLGLPAPQAVWPNPDKSRLLQLGPGDVIVAESLSKLLDVEERIVQYPGETLKHQWAFFFGSAAPPRLVLTNDPEGEGHPIDTSIDRAKWLAWATRFDPVPLGDLVGQDSPGQLGHGLKRVHRKGEDGGTNSIVVPDDVQETIHDLIVRLYVDDKLAMGKIVKVLKERNLRGPRGGKLNHKAVRKILVSRGVRIRRPVGRPPAFKGKRE